MINAKAETIDEYIAGFPKDIQKILEQMRSTIKKAAPDAKETIKYAMPTFTLNGNLVYFAAFKNHIGFYATPTGNEEFKKALSKYKTGKGVNSISNRRATAFGFNYQNCKIQGSEKFREGRKKKKQI